MKLISKTLQCNVEDLKLVASASGISFPTACIARFSQLYLGGISGILRANRIASIVSLPIGVLGLLFVSPLFLIIPVLQGWFAGNFACEIEYLYASKFNSKDVDLMDAGCAGKTNEDKRGHIDKLYDELDDIEKE